MERVDWMMNALSAAMIAERRGDSAAVRSLQELAIAVIYGPYTGSRVSAALCESIHATVSKEVLVGDVEALASCSP